MPTAWADNSPGAPAVIDWDATLAYRHELWSYGLGVADAMDTAQRGMGLDWAATRELITRSGAEAHAAGGAIACGAGTDQLDLADLPAGPGRDHRHHRRLPRADRRGHRGRRQRHPDGLPRAGRTATGADDYLRVYETLLDEVDTPVILHWLGTMFDPALPGYWGSDDIPAATKVFADLSATQRRQDRRGQGFAAGRRPRDRAAPRPAGRASGCTPATTSTTRSSSSATGRTTRTRCWASSRPSTRRPPPRCRPYDAGDAATGTGDPGLHPGTRPAHLLARPPCYYKTGIAFLSWLNGQQPGFAMVGGLQLGRSLPHLVETFRLADRAGLLTDPDLAARRLADLLSVNGWRAGS